MIKIIGNGHGQSRWWIKKLKGKQNSEVAFHFSSYFFPRKASGLIDAFFIVIFL